MENITCKGCQATVDINLEFCSSCGEWLGLKLDEVIDDVSVENTSEAKRMRIEKLLDLPVKPLSNYGATNLPNRKEVPGIRAVFFLALIVPLIAGASFFYNSRVANEVIEEIAIIEQTPITSTSTTIEGKLKFFKPISCSSSSNFSDDFLCTNLYDDSPSTWQDAQQSCADAFLEFEFDRPISWDTIIIQNPEKSTTFIKNFKMRDINITTENPEFIIEKELQNNQSQQWVSFDTVSSKIRIEVISAYPGEELNGQKAFKECAIQEISFLGR